MIRQSLALSPRMQLQASPRLQQAVRLLQMSALQFEQELEQQLERNPFLEPGEDIPEASNDAEARAVIPDRRAASVMRASGDDADVADWARAPTSMRDFLREQLCATTLPEPVRLAAGAVIESLDDDGYLRQDVAELARSLPPGTPLTAAALAEGLRVVRSFEPAGVGAHDLCDCLALQLEALSEDTPVRALALTIVRYQLDLLARHDYASIRRALRCSDDDLHAAHALIKQMHPRPGRQISADGADYVVPDVFVFQRNGTLTTQINAALMPKLRLNQVYVDLMRRSRNGSHAAMSRQLQEARWLLRNAEQRFVTIKRVADAIVTRQRAFFVYGDIALKPLVLREIADELMLHESTVSRATAHKYMATPRGLFEFKHFFSRQLATRTGGRCSAAAVQALIREMIAAENGATPLSDIDLACQLGAQGIRVARRTVTKYRTRMRLPPADLRRTA
ncbi:MAG TPA: RNA polymerase factor sigma-54 [Nevskiaceae bacterium]|nr:RNA polymerase factor sigma-54 [Nevskiaceae bacterium]